MARSIKLKNENYIDSTGVVHDKKKLSDVLNNIFEWKLVGSVNGTSTLALPSKFSELFISLVNTDTNAIMATGIVAKNILDNSLEYVRLAGGLTSEASIGSASEVLVSLKQYKLSWVYMNTKNITNQIKSTVYYR